MDDKPISLLSFSCLFLDLKFLLFFRAFEYFGVYFAIIISVAKEIASFLVLLFIIVLSFAHAFYILSDSLLDTPSINNDNQLFDNPSLIQFKTSLFAMYQLLTGIFQFKFVFFFSLIFYYKYFFNPI
jgi:hypothetical protein